MTNNILIFGTGGHARVVSEAIQKQSQYQIIGFVGPKKNQTLNDLPYPFLGDESNLKEIISKNNITGGIIAIGENSLRKKVYSSIIKVVSNFNFINCIHPFSSIADDVIIGNGNVILAGAVVNTNTKIGDHCILNTRSSLDHDCKLSSFSSIGPNAVVGGGTKIGEQVFLGIGAIIFQGLSIEDRCTIGAASLVNKNTLSDSLYYGSPAKLIKRPYENKKIF